MVPVIKLLEVVKPHIAGNQEAKALFSDIITMTGQVQYNSPLRRRYMIKPHLKKKYHNLCHISMPISNIGDDVSKEVKNSDTGISIAKDGYNSIAEFRRIPMRCLSYRSRQQQHLLQWLQTLCA